MCWSASASMGIVALGVVATGVSLRRRDTWPVPLALGYFTFMEALQVAGYAVLDECGTGANRAVTLLSYLHIVFQPVVINILLLTLLPEPVRKRLFGWVMAACALSVGVMLWQLVPDTGLSPCGPGHVLCGENYCTITGTWHLGWTVPYNDVPWLAGNTPGPFQGFPTYTLAVFVMPVLYGAWRFVLFHGAVGPWLAQVLTDNPNEWPAVWCLFSLGIAAVFVVPPLRRFFEVRSWPLWRSA